jgi:hypothetical protein
MATPANARAARERKQKIFVAVGGLVLLLLLAIQLPKLLGGSEPTASGTTTTATTLDGETTTGSGTPTTGSTPTSVALTDTDPPLPVGQGQLRSFSAFDRKDPFVQLIKSPSPSAGTSDSGDGGSGDGGSTGGGDDGNGGGGAGGGNGGGDGEPNTDVPSKGFNTDAVSSAAVTVISVNGTRQALAAGAAFPAADPVFVLVAENAARKTAVIGVVGGAYANGARTTRLKVGKPLVLVNTTTGARYRIVLIAVGNGSSPAADDGKDAPAPPTPTP